MASLSDKAGFLIIANLIKYAVGFIMPMVLVRMLNRTDYGTYQQLVLLGTLGIATLVLGLPNSVYFFYDRSNAPRDKVLTLQTSGVLFLSGTAAALILIAARPLISALLQNPALSPLLVWYGIALGLLIATEHFVQLMIARDHYRTAVMVETAETIVRVLILVIPLLAGFGLMGLVMAQLGYAVLRFAIRSIWVLAPLAPLRKPEGQAWFARQQLGYAVPLAMMSLVGLVGGYLDKGLVATRFSPG